MNEMVLMVQNQMMEHCLLRILVDQLVSQHQIQFQLMGLHIHQLLIHRNLVPTMAIQKQTEELLQNHLKVNAIPNVIPNDVMLQNLVRFDRLRDRP